MAYNDIRTEVREVEIDGSSEKISVDDYTVLIDRTTGRELFYNNGIPFGATFVPVPVIKKLLDVSLTYAAGAGNAITYAENPFEGTAEINVDGTNKLFYGTSNEYVKYGAAVGTALKLGTAGVNARWIPYGSGLALGVPLRATIEGIGGHVIWGGAVTTIYIPKTVKPLVVAPTATVAPLGSGAGFQAVSQERANYDLFTFTGSITGLTFLSDITRDKALDTASQAKLTAAEKVQTYIAFEYLSTDGRTWIRVPISPGGSFTLTGVANDLVYFYYQ